MKKDKKLMCSYVPYVVQSTWFRMINKIKPHKKHKDTQENFKSYSKQMLLDIDTIFFITLKKK